MIERHKAQLGQNASAKGRSKTFEKEDEEQRLRDMGFSEQQIMMSMKSPKMRIQESKEQNDAEYQKSVITNYLQMHTNLAQQMVQDYKREAINKFIVELYCTGQSRKYLGKNRDLIEKAQFSREKWHRIKEKYDAAMSAKIEEIQNENLPKSVK